MLKVLREYDTDSEHIVEFTRDGETVLHTVKTGRVLEPIGTQVVQKVPTIEERLNQIERNQTAQLLAVSDLYELLLAGGTV